MVSSAHSIQRVWRVLFSILALQLAFGFIYVWGTVVPYVRMADHWSPLLTSAVFSAGPLGYASGMVISGRLAERYPPRRLCWTGAGLIVVGFAVAFLFPSGFTFILCYSAIGLGLGGAIAMAGALAAGVFFFPERVGTIGGVLTGSYALSAIFEVPLVGALVPTLGWLNTLRLIGSCVALLAVGVVLVMPAVPRPRHAQAGKSTVPFSQLIEEMRSGWACFSKRPQRHLALMLSLPLPSTLMGYIWNCGLPLSR